MTAETARMIAGVLAPRLGVEPGQLEGTLVDNPLAAAVALSMMGPDRQEEPCDPGATVRFVAALVGACELCLGEHTACRECGGKGGPGTRPPDAAALVAWIARPLQRLGLCVGRPRRETLGHNHGGGYG
jgi:hypothetical protein